MLARQLLEGVISSRCAWSALSESTHIVATLSASSRSLPQSPSGQRVFSIGCSSQHQSLCQGRSLATATQAALAVAAASKRSSNPQIRSSSGHKQRSSPYPARRIPDISPARFRNSEDASRLMQGGLIQQSKATTSRSEAEQRRVVLTTWGKKTYPQPQNKPAAPWTPTRLLGKRKVYTKRMGFLIQELEKEKEAELLKEKKLPNFGPGSVLELTLAVPENKGKPAVFKGLCIAVKHRGVRTSFTLLNHLGTYGRVERIFPLYSPTIKNIKVYEHRHTRRAKLYYLRDRHPREYRVK